MSTLSDPSTDHLDCLFDSLPGEPGKELDERLARLEESIEGQTARLDHEVLTRLQSLEDLLHLQVSQARTDIAREASERRDQFAALAAKISRKIDHLQRCACRLQEDHADSSHEDSE